MKKFKESTQDFRDRILGVRKEEVKQEAKEEMKQEQAGDMPYEVIDVIQDPTTKSRSYQYVKIKYNPATKQAIVETITPCIDKTTGYAMILDKDNRKYLFEKSNSGGKKS